MDRAQDVKAPSKTHGSERAAFREQGMGVTDFEHCRQLAMPKRGRAKTILFLSCIAGLT